MRNQTSRPALDVVIYIGSPSAFSAQLHRLYKRNNGYLSPDIRYLVPVAETVFVIPAEAGIQLFRPGPLLSQG